MLDDQLRGEDFFGAVGRVFSLYKESWEAFKLNWAVFVGFFAIVFGISFVMSFVATFFMLSSVASGSSSSLFDGMAFFIFLASFFVIMVVSLCIAPIVVQAQLDSAHMRARSLGEVINAAKPRILGFIGLGILIGVLVFAGLIFFIIPGLIVAACMVFAPFIYMDREISVTDAMKASYELSKRYWRAIVGMILVQFAITVASNIPFLGIFLAIPLSVMYFCITAVVYVKLTSASGAVATVTPQVGEGSTPAA